MAQLVGVTLADLDLGDPDLSLIAVRVIIRGRFTDVQNYKDIMRDVFYNRLNGAVFSCGIRINLVSATFPDAGRLNNRLQQYMGHTLTQYGSSDGWAIPSQITTRAVDITYVNSVVTQAGNGGLKYKNQFICNGYNGGNTSDTGASTINPIIIITDEYYNLFTLSNTGINRNTFLGNLTIVVRNEAVYPLPQIQWNYRDLIDDRFDYLTASDINAIQLSIYNVEDDIKNEYPVGPVDPGEDPYGPGGYSDGDGGGTGDWDYEGNPQPFGGLPSGLPDAIDTGFFSLYTPTAAEMRNLAGYLWSDQFDLNLFKKLFNNPMDLFLNLGIVPVDVPAGPQKEVGIGLISTGIYMTTASQRYISKNMGTVQVTMTHNSYIDFAPYVRADMILPYIGVVPMDIDAIMGRTIEVIYNVDILSGVCVAGINVIRSNGKHCIGTYAGNAMMSIPLTGADYSTILSGLIQTAGAIAAGAASGGAAGAVAGGLAASSSAVVNEGKPMIQRGGALSANAGFFITQQKPVLIVSIPRECVPYTQLTELGYPCYRSTSVKDQLGNVTLQTIGNESGFIKVASIHLQNIPATDEELSEIESLLKEGVYV